jgi:ABC-type branched-subunit amino acid transport system ATPase component
MNHDICPNGMVAVLELKDLSKSFDGLLAVQNANLVVLPGDRKAIIGPNGAGKTTLFNVIYKLFPRLHTRCYQRAKTLSGGEQQMLATGRALMTNPDCLIMDEPSEGLAPIIIQGLWEAIGTLRKEGLSILLVEQNAHLALKLVDYVHVMSKGQVVYSAKPEELRANEEIKSSYLGI